MTNTTDELLVELRELATRTALNAAELARDRRSKGVEVAYSKTAIADIVTEVDRECEQLIRKLLLDARPDDGFVGEEFDPSPSRSGISWVVDPIDGTVNFLYGLAPYAVSIAAIIGDPMGEWEPIVGVVINIPQNVIFTAAKGLGAHLGDQPIAVGKTADLAVTLVSTGYSYLPETRVRQARVTEHLLAEVRDIRRLGCASLDLCAVASGAIDVYFERGLKPWDYSAGTLIAREAGALVRGWSSDWPSEAFTIAGNPNLVKVLQPKIQNWMTEENLQPA